ncbi:RNA polymerase sigma factor [Engelhardtia mirabilis]|uniref:RNA polymerase sigma factor n=1 Tax=Engelhardtia mirabilis TaxID=2528011 RepID=UPI003AF3EE4F
MGGGDRLARLVAAHYLAVHRLLFRLVGNREDADDLAQECFVRAQRRGGEVDEVGALVWLRRVALNLARDHHRSRGRRLRREELAGLESIERRSGEPAPDARLRGADLHRALRQALGELPERLRVALVLRVFEGLDYDEIARLVGRRPGTVRIQVMKARRELERRMGPFLDEESTT